MEFWPLTLFILGFVIVSLILPWVLRVRIEGLRAEIAALRRELAKRPLEAPSTVEETRPVAAPTETLLRASEPTTEKIVAKAEEPASSVPEMLTQATPADEQVPRARESRQSDIEQQLGGRAAVWAGGVALALAGLFLVKYSIDTGLLTESVRVVLGCVFGAVMLVAASWIRSRNVANGERIGQALSGAGIAVLYVSFFAATSLYELLSPTLGFVALAAVTALAVALSVLHGPPIAVLGLVGGFLTPALVETDAPSASGLFLYLGLLVAGIMAVVRAKSWEGLIWPTLAGSFLWVGLWLMGFFSTGDAFWIAVFLSVLAAAVILAASDGRAETDQRPSFSSRQLVGTLTLCLVLLTMGLTVGRADFGLMSWGLFGLLSAGSIALAYAKPNLYQPVPWISALVAGVLLCLWEPNELSTLFGVLVAFAVLHVAASTALLWRSVTPQLWAALGGASAIGFFVIAYFRLRYAPFLSPLPFVWGIAALTLSAASIVAVRQVMNHLKVDGPPRDYAIAAFAATATAFLSIGLGIELEREFLSVAFAAEVLGLAWIMTRVAVPGLRQIAIAVAVVFAGLLAPQLLLLVQLAIFSLTQLEVPLQSVPPIVQWPLFQLGLPALFFASASILLRRSADDWTVRSFEAGAVAMAGLMIYYLTRKIFHAPQDLLFMTGTFVERALTTNVLYVFGLVALWLGRRFERRAIDWSAALVLAIALFRTGFFDLIRDNPLFSYQAVGQVPIFNALILAFVLPVLWIELTLRVAGELVPKAWTPWLQRFEFFLAFVAVTLETRHLFHPRDMSAGGLAGAEVYAYSIVWLVMAILVLFLGTLVKSRSLRIASLALMVLTVSKVFLYDASELTGLFRVLSFLGLGVSLLGLGYFYRRFVLVDDAGSEPKPA